MPLSWNEIKDRALNFSKEWEDAFNEDADAKPFLVDFFNVFGISQRKVASFEHRVKKLNEHEGYIDMLWKGMLLVEMKSRGKNLDSAYQQARDYLAGLKEHELPKYILVSDFVTLRLYDMEEEKTIEFKLNDLVDNVQHFGFISGYQKKVYKEQDPANIKAAELMGKLHDRLKEIGYEGHPLEVYLVRLLFCLFADDTTIFNKQQFQDFIELRTNEDGSDLAAKLQELFQVLNTPSEQRYKNLDEQLAEFPYVNGKLFEEMLPMPSFDSKMRKALLDCCSIDWARISPAIFGSMFQSVMNPIERRNLGAHYTSEKNILKVIKPLFLDELWEEFEKIKNNIGKLQDFHSRIASLKFLDPACGCGNFLVIAYRELRMLELEILRNLNKSGQGALDISDIVKLDVDMMYGIEIEEFPARIAEVAMWLIDHQMNMRVSNEFGQYFTRLPLKKAAKVVNDNALRLEWPAVVEKKDLSYILGNPPFIGKHLQNIEQKRDLNIVFENQNGSGILDYVTAWYLKAARMIQGTEVKVAFVSTNSIAQGEQVGVLWNILYNSYGIKIHFAHKTFRWANEAKSNAAVHVVIIGFGAKNVKRKFLFEYQPTTELPSVTIVDNINPYLFSGKDIFLSGRSIPICDVPAMQMGSKPTDGGNLIFEPVEYEEFIKIEPASRKYIRKFVSADDFINGKIRYCLWLVNINPDELRNSSVIMDRLKKVREMRLSSTKLPTRKWADRPMLFAEIRQPLSDYLLVPSVSSENRKYVPIGYLDKDIIVNNASLAIPNATLFHFGILTSEMHMVWTRYVCGRLESRYRYSNTIVYNNFPWPESPTEKQKEEIERCAQSVLDARAQFPESSLADLYDPLTMPPVLLKAHQSLDKAVDLAYRPQPFASDAKRMEYLFELYEKYTQGMFGEGKKASSKNKRRNKH
jgi:type I restriction-modification system DNA methylase subunit